MTMVFSTRSLLGVVLAIYFSIHDASAVDETTARQSKQRQLQFIPGDLCRCEAEWEDFYSDLLALQQPQPPQVRSKYPGLNGNGGDRRRRFLQHYDYDTQEENSNGLTVVEGVFVLPPVDPFCENLANLGNRRDRDLATVSSTATTTANGAYTRGNGRLEILIGGTQEPHGRRGASTSTSGSTSVQEHEDEAAGERDLVNCHGDNLGTVAAANGGGDGPYYNYYGTRRNPYNTRTANNVYAARNPPGTYWANRPANTASAGNARTYGARIQGIGKGKCNQHYSPVAAPSAGPPSARPPASTDCNDLGPGDIANCCFSLCDGSESGGIDQPSGTICAACACDCPPIPQVYLCPTAEDVADSSVSATNANSNDNALAQSPPPPQSAEAPPLLTDPVASAPEPPANVQQQQQQTDLSSSAAATPDDELNSVADPCRVEVNIGCAEAEDGISVACANYFFPIDSLVCECNEGCAKSYNFVYTGLDCSSSSSSSNAPEATSVISCQDHASFVQPRQVRIMASGGGRQLLDNRAIATQVLTLQHDGDDMRCLPNEVNIRVTDMDDPDLVYQTVVVNTACDDTGLRLNDKAGAFEFAGYNCQETDGVDGVAGTNCLQDVALYMCGENTGPQPFLMNSFKVNVDGDETDLFDAAAPPSRLEPLATLCVQDQVRTVNMCSPGFHYLRAQALGTCDDHGGL